MLTNTAWLFPVKTIISFLNIADEEMLSRKETHAAELNVYETGRLREVRCRNSCLRGPQALAPVAGEKVKSEIISTNGEEGQWKEDHTSCFI